LSSVVFTALAGTFNMGIGAIVGSAIFNILVIPALSGIATDGDLETRTGPSCTRKHSST